MKNFAAAIILISGCSTAGTFYDSQMQELRINVTRILLEIKNDPVYYLDEPASAYMSLVVQSSNELLDELNRSEPRFSNIDLLSARLVREIDRLEKLSYDLKLKVKTPSNNVIKLYYSLGDF